MPWEFGPDNGSLIVRTRKAGAASKAGHNLRMEVADWHATLDLDASPSLALTANPRSFRVLEGTGGVMPLGDEEKAAIPKTIDDEVLGGSAIEFHSTRIARDGERVEVQGELELAGRRAPVSFELTVNDGHVRGTALVKQTNWGMKPYSALFGTLKVADEVEVEVDARTRSDSDG